VRMDSANFQTVWTAFGIFFIFPKRNTSRSRKKYLPSRNFVPPVGFGPKNPMVDLGAITWGTFRGTIGKITSVLWLGTRKDQIVRGGVTPVHLISYAWNFDRIFCRSAGNNVDMDSAKFRRDWTTFDIFSILPKRNNSSES